MPPPPGVNPAATTSAPSGGGGGGPGIQSGIEQIRQGNISQIFPEMAGPISREVEDEANRYFQQVRNPLSRLIYRVVQKNSSILENFPSLLPDFYPMT